MLCTTRYLMKAVEGQAVQAGKWERNFTLLTKAKTIRLNKSVYARFQFPKARKDRFKKLN